MIHGLLGGLYSGYFLSGKPGVEPVFDLAGSSKEVWGERGLDGVQLLGRVRPTERARVPLLEPRIALFRPERQSPGAETI